MEAEETTEGLRIRRNVKDSVFVRFFRERENVFELYRELHPEDVSTRLEDVRIRTVKRVIAKGFYNDLGFSVGDKLICLVEAQSYPDKAMKVRAMVYLLETLKGYMAELGTTVFDADRLPDWEAYVIRTGRAGERMESLEVVTHSLSDDSGLVRVEVGEGGLIWGYMEACRIIDSEITSEGNYGRREDVLRALDKCKARCGKIGEFIWSRRFEIMSLYEELFDDEENLRMNCRISERIGHEKGLKEGREEGREKGREEGLEEGIATGKRLQMEETAKRLLSKGMPVDEVSEVTGMSPEDVRRMRSNGA